MDQCPHQPPVSGPTPINGIDFDEDDEAMIQMATLLFAAIAQEHVEKYGTKTPKHTCRNQGEELTWRIINTANRDQSRISFVCLCARF